MKKSIGKPCEGKLHARFDEGGADCFYYIRENRSKAIRVYSTPPLKNVPDLNNQYFSRIILEKKPNNN